MNGVHSIELNCAIPSGRVKMFAIPDDDDYPGRWFY